MDLHHQGTAIRRRERPLEFITQHRHEAHVRGRCAHDRKHCLCSLWRDFCKRRSRIEFLRRGAEERIGFESPEALEGRRIFKDVGRGARDFFRALNKAFFINGATEFLNEQALAACGGCWQVRSAGGNAPIKQISFPAIHAVTHLIQRSNLFASCFRQLREPGGFCQFLTLSLTLLFSDQRHPGVTHADGLCSQCPDTSMRF